MGRQSADIENEGPRRGVKRWAREQHMIQLTRLNNQPLIVNSDLIKFVEKAPDTVLTLTTGEKIVVLESSEQVLEKVIEFRRTVLSGLTVRTPETSATSPTGSAVAHEKTEPA
jgi:flagellar protein FlbD